MRRYNPALVDGDFQFIDKQSRFYLGFTRRSMTHRQRLLILLNFSPATIPADSAMTPAPGRLLFSTQSREKDINDICDLKLAPYEIFIAELFQ
jgi:hypothetical protein